MTIISILLILGAINGMLLALFLFTNNAESRGANRYLALLVILLSLELFDTDLFLDEFTSDSDFFQLLIWPKEFLYGPLLYFYVRELVLPNKYLLKGKQWRHFLPGLMQMILIWPLLFLDDSRIDQIFTDSPQINVNTIWAFLIGGFENIAAILHIGFYLYLALRLLHQHHFFLQNNYSYIDKINLNWLRLLISILGFIWLIWAGTILIIDDSFIISIMDFCIAALIFLMGYMGLRHPIIYSQRATSEMPDNIELTEISTQIPNATEKYQKSALSFDQSLLLVEELEMLMKEKKLYLDSKLSLAKLAKNIDITPNYLSQIINEQKKHNFFDFINGYRIKDAKHRLLDPQNANEKILTIAMDVGFNSKSSFYTAFRKATGITPKQFKDSKK